jgi:putative serine protease PepD
MSDGTDPREAGAPDGSQRDGQAADQPADDGAWWSRPASGPYGAPDAGDQPAGAQPYAPPGGQPPYGQEAGQGHGQGTGQAYGQDRAQGSGYDGRQGQRSDGGHGYEGGHGYDGGQGYGQAAGPGYGQTASQGGQPYAAPQGAPAYSAQGSAQPAFGQAPTPRVTAGSTALDSRPGDDPWGYPTDTLGAARPPRVRRRGLGVAAAVLAAALVGGISGGLVGADLAGDDGDLTDPSVSLGSGLPTSQSQDRAPDSVAGIAARVLRSTVSIAVREGNSGGSGSGVVLSADGFVLTNNHVVAAGADGAEITVTVNGSEGREFPAEIVGRDPETDLAVIKVAGVELQPATLGRSADLVVGDPVVAIGSPLGLNGTVTTGIISALNRTVNVPGENGERATPLLNAIQTDAAINPGNSGGALVDARGAVIGINSAIATLGGSTSEQGGSIGVGFAIPVDEARSVAEEIIRTGRATHPAIGVEAGNQTADDGSKLGARLTRIITDGPASDAGLQVGDVVDEVGGDAVGSVDELILALRQHKVGESVTVTFQRDGREQTAQVTLADKSGG